MEEAFTTGTPKTSVETPSIGEGNIDILNWLTKAVLEDDIDSTSFPIKTESVDFDLLQYVQSSGDSTDIQLDEKMIDSLFSLEPQKHADDNVDMLERAIDCPASPFCKSEEIVDYIENSTDSISGSPLCEENMEEPDWLSTWDSV